MFATTLVACASPHVATAPRSATASRAAPPTPATPTTPHVATTPEAAPTPALKPALGPDARVDVDGPDAAAIEAAVPRAIARLDIRGLHLSAPTRIRTHSTHDEFERSAHHVGDGLRGWTTFDVVDLAPLADWANADDEAVVERVTHELCHAAISQRFGSFDRALAARVPRFFGEGACTLVAGQTRTAPTGIADDLNGDAAFAYYASYRAMKTVDEKLGPLGFAHVVDAAAKDGEPGCIERALRAAGVDIDGTQP